MRHTRSLGWLLLLSGCATNFTGSAHIEGGRAGCEHHCSADGLHMSALVYMGEYSSACVCEVPHTAAHGGAPAASASAASTATAVAVITQMAQQQSSSSYNSQSFIIR